MARSSQSPRFGSAHALAAALNPDAYFRYRSQGGVPFAMDIPGLGEVLLAATPDAVREFMDIPSSAFTPPTPNPIEPVVGDGSIILLSGEPHRSERARLLPALHGDRLRRYADAMAQAAQAVAATWQPGVTVDVRDSAQSITLIVIVRAIFGIDEPHRCDEFVRVIKDMMDAYKAPLMFLPILRRAPAGLGPWGRFCRRRIELDDMLSEQIALRRRSIGSDGHDDVLSVLLSEADGGGERDDDVVRQQLRTLLAAGHETTATTLAWALYHIHRDVDVRSRIHAELASHPTPEEMSRLPYLRAVIKETLRMHPTVSIVLRRLKSPVTAWKTRRAHGDVIGVALPALHADPAVWPDAQRFDPERFLTDKPTPFEYAPFGYGHRRCIGSAFATLELAVVLGTILSEVELTATPWEHRRRPPRSVPRGIAALPHRRIKLKVVRRLTQRGPGTDE
jgi:cytochrome P450